MKIIEAMKRVKMNKTKITELTRLIAGNSALLSIETPSYKDTAAKIEEWVQSCTDLAQDNARLLCAIARTNLATSATITLSGKDVTKTIAEWVWRRREYAKMDYTVWSNLTDRGLKDQVVKSSAEGAAPTAISVVRFYDPEKRDKMLAIYRMEPHEIDSALEVVNATTDLIEA